MRVCVRPGCEREIPQDAPENRVYCDGRCRTAHWRLQRETPKRVKPSGRQVSYRKAVAVLQRALIWHGGFAADEALARAEDAMAMALPERQR